MKKNRKWKRLLVIPAMLLLISGVAGIISYLSGRDSAVNTMVIGGVNVEIVENFVPPKVLEAGTSFTKDVKVNNLGPSDAYVRVKVLFSDSEMEKYSTLDWNETDWILKEDGYWYYVGGENGGSLKAKELTSSLFTTVTLSSEITKEEIKDFDIYVYVEGYQTGEFTNYEDAWNHYKRNKPASEGIDGFFISYFSNSSEAVGSMESSSHVVGDGSSLSPNQFTREGYLFKGWNTEKDGSGVSYSDGAVADIETVRNTIIPLYAQWEEAPPVLMSGSDFNDTITDVITSATKSVVITDEKAPSGVNLIDVSEEQNGSVVTWLDGSTCKVSSQRSGVKVIANSYSPYMFQYLRDISYIDVSMLDVSNAEYLNYAFYQTGQNASTFEIVGLDNWNMVSATDISYMFQMAGQKATSWNIGDLSKWNVSNVSTACSMFYFAGYNATTFNIGNLKEKKIIVGDGTTYTAWNVSNFEDMSDMFDGAGKNATTFNIGDISNWKVGNVWNMAYMFYGTGEKATNWSLDLSGWDVSNVSDYESFNYGVESKVTAPTWVL